MANFKRGREALTRSDSPVLKLNVSKLVIPAPESDEDWADEDMDIDGLDTPDHSDCELDGTELVLESNLAKKKTHTKKQQKRKDRENTLTVDIPGLRIDVPQVTKRPVISGLSQSRKSKSDNGEPLAKKAKTTPVYSSTKITPANLDIFQNGKWKNFVVRKRPRPEELKDEEWYFCPFWYDYSYDTTFGTELKVFGVMRDGHSCCIRIHGFMPYFFARVPPSWNDNFSTDQMMLVLRGVLKHLNTHVHAKLTKVERNTLRNVDELVKPEPCLQKHINARGFQGFEPKWFAKIFTTYPTLIRHSRIALETPFGGRNHVTDTSYEQWLPHSYKRPSDMRGPSMKPYLTDHGFLCFEAHVDYIVRYLTDCDMPASDWWTVGQKGRLLVPFSSQKTLCDIEFTIPYQSLERCKNKELENEEPIYIDAKFDIEAAGQKDQFPQPETDPVIQISIRMRYSAFGKLDPTKQSFLSKALNKDETYRHNQSICICLCLKSVRNQTNFEAICFETEHELLTAFYEIISVIQPDALAGHYSNGFDWKYLIKRAKQLGIRNFNSMGKVPGQTIYNNADKNDTTKKGKDRPTTKVPGVWVWDFINYAQDFLYDTKSYSLNALAQLYLGDMQKLDVEYSMISKMQETEEGRSKLAAYCDRDVLLLEKLDDKHTASAFIREIGNVCNVPPQQILDRASVFRISGKWLYESQRYYDHVMRTKGGTLRFFKNRVRYLTPTKAVLATYDYDIGKYKGGSVMAGCPGFYKLLITIFDFKSLYPSIIIRFNIGYITFVEAGTQKMICDAFGLNIDNDLWHVPTYKLTADKKTTEPHIDMENNPSFVKSHVLVSLLAHIEEMLLDSRDAKKRNMKEYLNKARAATTEHERDLYMFLAGKMNLAQLAFKIVCNTVYGTLGMSKSNFPLRPAAQTITKMARQSLEIARYWFETNITKKKGYPFDAEIIYGDTDSVFVLLKNYDEDDPSQPEKERIERAYPHMKKIEKELCTLYQKPMELVFEKISVTSYMLTPKCYGLQMTEEVNKPTFTKQSGTSGVRRGGCLLQREMCNRIMHKLLKEKDEVGAIQIARDTLARVMSGKVEHHEILMRSTLSKPPSQYDKTVPPHVAMARKLMKSGDKEYKAGDRIYFIVVGGPPKSKISDRVETPKKVIKQNIPYDRAYYTSVIINESKKLLRALLDERTYEEKREFADWVRITSFDTDGQKLIDKRKNELKKKQDKRVESVILHGADPTLMNLYKQSKMDYEKFEKIEYDSDSDLENEDNETEIEVDIDKEIEENELLEQEDLDKKSEIESKTQKETAEKDKVFWKNILVQTKNTKLSDIEIKNKSGMNNNGQNMKGAKRHIAKPPIPDNNIFKNFVKVLDQCAACGDTVSDDANYLCVSCDTVENRRIYYNVALQKYNRYSSMHHSCWTRCHRCRGKVLVSDDKETCDITNCINYECDNWARREVSTREVQKASAYLEKIGNNFLDEFPESISSTNTTLAW